MPTLDVRSKRGRTQIRGALRYDPKALLSQAELALPLPHDGRIVVYADTNEDAARIAQRLQERGYHDAAILDGGFEAYEKAGLPVEDATQEQPVPGTESGIPRV